MQPKDLKKITTKPSLHSKGFGLQQGLVVNFLITLRGLVSCDANIQGFPT